MKLDYILIENYRSISKAGFPVDWNLTTIVGANEHGKTNLLRAIQLLDFKTPIKTSDRRVAKNPISEEVTETKITYTLLLSDKEKLNMESRIKELEIKVIPTSETSEESKPVIKRYSYEVKPLIDFKIAFLDGTVNSYSLVNNDGLNPEQEKAIMDIILSGLEKKIFYFDTFEDKLKHRIPKDEIIQKNNDVTNGLMKLAGLAGKESNIFEESSIARQLRLRGGEQLTEQIKKMWIQGKEDNIVIRLELSTDGNFLNIDTEDFNTYGDVSTRSRGFLFFLAFILKFKEYYDGDLEDFIFLIDEPGIFLHPRGQKDLLLYLEDLSGHNQMIYTTHSPFMINRLNNFRVRVVSKDKQRGTEVDVKPYIHNWKSLRASLGMMLSDSFYYADNNLIVEGPSERLYLLTLLKIFHEHSIVKSDLNILSIIDSGGASNAASMCKIVYSEERPYVVLTDSDTSGQRAKNAIIKFTDPEKVKEVNEFKKTAVTTEDLLPKKYIDQAINNYINQLADDGVCSKPEKIFNSESKKGGIINQLEKYIEENIKGVEEISKLNIARHFEELVSVIPKKEFKVEEFSDVRPLVDWVSKILKISTE